MKMEVTIQWLLEVMDEHGDIADILHCDSYAEAKDAADNFYTDASTDIGLVRDVGNDEEGIIDRQWVYVRDGKLPAQFEDGAKVPARYHKEIAA